MPRDRPTVSPSALHTPLVGNGEGLATPVANGTPGNGMSEDSIYTRNDTTDLLLPSRGPPIQNNGSNLNPNGTTIKTPLFTSHDPVVVYREDEYTINGHDTNSEISMELVRRRNLSVLREQEKMDIYGNDTDDVRMNTSFTAQGGSPASMVHCESLDYEIIDSNKQKVNTEKSSSAQFFQNIAPVHYQLFGYTVMKWFIALAIGVLTAVSAFVLNLCVENGAALKFGVTLWAMRYSYFLSFLLYLIFNIIFVACAAVLVTYMAPAAAGSGIPDVKAYLNGIDYAGVLVPQTLFSKLLGGIGSVAGGLAVGKEGPLVHIGACWASVLTQMNVQKPSGLSKVLSHFHNDRDRRDMVTCGAAAGVAAAFRAPVGGVLFALEEATSWRRPRLTWRAFFCTATVSVVLKALIHICSGDRCGAFGSGTGGFIIFDISEGGQDDYKVYELIPMALLGVTGGLLGALFNYISKIVCVWRRNVLSKRGNIVRVVEAIIIATLTSIVSFCVPLMVSCRKCPENADAECPRDNDVHFGNFIPFNCHREGYYNDLATIFFNTNDDSIRNLLSSGTKHEFSTASLFIYLPLMFILAVITYGISVPSGLFVPCILIGACYGRLVGKVVSSNAFHVEEGTYALLGAASFLGGTMRMTVSLVAILLELTNQLALLPLVMLVLLISKVVGDCLTKAIYDIHMEIKSLPFLDAAPPRTFSHLRVDDLTDNPLDEVLQNGENDKDIALRDTDMHGDALGGVSDSNLRFNFGDSANGVVNLNEVALISGILRILKMTTHNCFPVFALEDGDTQTRNGGGSSPKIILKGTILRRQLLVLLRHRSVFQPEKTTSSPSLSPTEIKAMQEEMREVERKKVSVSASCKTLDELLYEIDIQPEDQRKYINLSPYLNQSPYLVSQGTSYAKVYQLFRQLGLRHILVVPKPQVVSALITRRDLLLDSGELANQVVDTSVGFSLTQRPNILWNSAQRTRRSTSYIRYE